MFYKIYKGLVGISLPPEISHTTRVTRSPNCVSFHQLTTLNDASKFSFYPKSIRYTYLLSLILLAECEANICSMKD